MKKFMWLLLLAFVFVAGTYSFSVAAEVIKLKAANYLPPTHKMSVLTDTFCQEIKKRTNGRVEVTYYPGGTLLDPVKMFNGVTTGITDIGVSHIDYTRGRFPVTEVFDLPLGFPSGWVASQTSEDFYNKFKPAEWDSVKVLYINTSGPLILQTIAKPVKTLEEIKGLKVRATGQMADVIKALGAVPVPLQMPDVYEALRRGVIDGVTVDLSTLKYWKFADVVKYVTADWRLGTGYTFYCVMNKNKWNSLPADLKKIFDEVSHQTFEAQAALWNEMDLEGKEVFTGGGGQILPLSDAEVVKWVKAVEPVIAAYKKDMVSKGHKEADVDSWLSYIKERTEYYRKQEKQKKIAAPFE
ncbi:MAG TPA: TRAP transporter substrate-binding protein [Syntrophorhabdales bacterium]|nr:TRAP transporter substrate-binding protein [Syntrophorhabdales bacterium]